MDVFGLCYNFQLILCKRTVAILDDLCLVCTTQKILPLSHRNGSQSKKISHHSKYHVPVDMGGRKSNLLKSLRRMDPNSKFLAFEHLEPYIISSE